MTWRVKIVCLLVAAMFFGFAFYYTKFYVHPQKHGIILFVVPGLSPELLSLAESQKMGRTFNALGTPDQMLWVRSRSPGNITGDFASLMTYLSSGTPSLSGQVGVSVTGQRLDTLLYRAQREGRAVGIISTTRLTSPGVAAFYAHTEDATQEFQTAIQLIDSTKMDVVMGGGGEVFYQALKNSGRDLIKEAELEDYRIVRTRSEFQQTQPWRRKKLLAFFSQGDLMYHSEHPNPPNDDTPPTLPDMTRIAVQKLQYHFGGYFLVINHELIAKACRQNRSAQAVQETLQLDEAVQTALRYAGKNTLVIVYAPLQMGGLQVVADPMMQGKSSSIPPISWHSGPGEQSGKNGFQYADAEPSGFYRKEGLISISPGLMLIFGQQWEDAKGMLDAGAVHALLKKEL